MKDSAKELLGLVFLLLDEKVPGDFARKKAVDLGRDLGVTVTKAGAGGRALQLTEAETMEKVEEVVEEATFKEEETEEPQAPVFLSESEVQELLDETNLPDASKARLAEGQYADEDGARGAIKAEIAYVKELTNSGKPSGMGGAAQPKPLTEDEKLARFNQHLAEVGMRPVA
jgi:hypothetical protein